MMAIFIGPHMSGMTGHVVESRVSKSQFRRIVVWPVGSRLAGTLLVQALLVPSALLAVYVARRVSAIKPAGVS